MPVKSPSSGNGSDFPKWPEGEYIVEGLRWFTVDENKAPKFVDQWGRMVARCNLLVEGQDDGPPMTVEVHEMPLLVMAFGGDPTKLPHKENDYATYLVAVQKLAKGKKLKAFAKKGKADGSAWVNTYSLEGMEVPKGFYRFQFIAARRSNTQPYLFEGKKGGKFSRPILKIVSDYMGNPTLYDGIEKSDPCGYFGKPMDAFIDAFAPHIKEDGFPDPDDPENIWPELEFEAQKAGRLANAQIVPNKNNYLAIDYTTLMYVPGEAPKQKDAPPPWEDPEPHPAYEFLVNVITEGVTIMMDRKEDAWEGGGKPSQAGKTWAGTYITRARKKIGLEINTFEALRKLEGKDIIRLMRAIELEPEDPPHFRETIDKQIALAESTLVNEL